MNLTLAKVLARKVYQEVVLYFKYGPFLKSEGIIKAILENSSADQNTLFHTPVIFRHLKCPFSQ